MGNLPSFAAFLRDPGIRGEERNRVIDQVLHHDGIDRSTTVIALATQIPFRVLPLVRTSAGPPSPAAG